MKYILVVLLATSLTQAGEPTPMDKEEAKAFFGLAQSSYQKGEVDKALDWASKSKEKFDSMEAECLKANILESQKKYTEAKSGFERAKDLSFLNQDTRDKLNQKLAEIKRALQDYEYKKQEFVNYIKMSARSSSPYVADVAKEDLKRLMPEKDSSNSKEIVVYTTSSGAKYTIMRDGTCTAVDPNGNFVGKWTKKANQIVISWSSGSTHTLVPDNSRAGFYLVDSLSASGLANKKEIVTVLSGQLQVATDF